MKEELPKFCSDRTSMNSTTPPTSGVVPYYKRINAKMCILIMSPFGGSQRDGLSSLG